MDVDACADGVANLDADWDADSCADGISNLGAGWNADACADREWRGIDADIEGIWLLFDSGAEYGWGKEGIGGDSSSTMERRALQLYNESNDGILPKAGEIGIYNGFLLLIFLLLDAVTAASGL